jgi:hypothetical protein
VSGEEGGEEKEKRWTSDEEKKERERERERESAHDCPPMQPTARLAASPHLCTSTHAISISPVLAPPPPSSTRLRPPPPSAPSGPRAYQECRRCAGVRDSARLLLLLLLPIVAVVVVAMMVVVVVVQLS